MRPVPATKVSVPLPAILNRAFEDVKYTLPLLSTASRCGCAMDVLSAAAGVAGRPPPATVDTKYCGWAAAKAEKAKASPSDLFNRGYKKTLPIVRRFCIRRMDPSILVHPRP